MKATKHNSNFRAWLESVNLWTDQPVERGEALARYLEGYTACEFASEIEEG
jgi:hypothetical protein